MSSNRYDNTGGGAIEVISPAGSPVQPQQEKPEEAQQQTGTGTSVPHFRLDWLNLVLLVMCQ